jgi:hypothetical protein
MQSAIGVITDVGKKTLLAIVMSPRVCCPAGIYFGDA